MGSNPIGATNQNPLRRKGFCASWAENSEWFALGIVETLVLPRFGGVGILESVVSETRKEGHTCRTAIHPSSVAESWIWSRLGGRWLLSLATWE